jgi:hypothetical protein
MLRSDREDELEVIIRYCVAVVKFESECRLRIRHHKYSPGFVSTLQIRVSYPYPSIPRAPTSHWDNVLATAKTIRIGCTRSAAIIVPVIGSCDLDLLGFDPTAPRSTGKCPNDAAGGVGTLDQTIGSYVEVVEVSCDYVQYEYSVRSKAHLPTYQGFLGLIEHKVQVQSPRTTINATIELSDLRLIRTNISKLDHEVSHPCCIHRYHLLRQSATLPI